MILSIIIASLDRHNDLSVCLDSIDHLVVARKLQKIIEVYVVDQSQITFKPIKDYNFKFFVLASEKGASRARNKALKECSGKYVWFVDDDAIIIDLDLEALISQSKHVSFLNWKECPIMYLPGVGRRINLVRKSGAPFFIIDTQMLRKLGGFDERLGPGAEIPAGEDLDIILRLDNEKKICDFNTLGSVSHPYVEHNMIKSLSYVRSRGIVLKKNKEILLFILDVLYSFRRFNLNGLRRARSLLEGYIYNKPL